MLRWVVLRCTQMAAGKIRPDKPRFVAELPYIYGMKYLSRIIGLLVWALGVYMIDFGIEKDMAPPIMTGVGFILIGLAFLLQRSKDA